MGQKNGPALAPTSEGPNPNPGVEVGLLPIIDEARHRASIHDYLWLTREQGRRYENNLRYYARGALAQGVPVSVIASELGMTDALVREIVKDDGDA